MNDRIYLLLIPMFFATIACGQPTEKNKDEVYRPQIHFSPKQNWANDPNGMVYHKGTYHLFYQHHPFSSVWGPMHWGHATSKDLITWKHEPIALYPDSLGTIFSGCAVLDENNTSGFGKNGEPPLVAIFTQHNMAGEKAGKNDYQTQGLAYSTDHGRTWVKYHANPVLQNPGITDFRDPKVMWYEAQQKWVMTLATKDRITFYSSKNLKSWTKESEFGATVGAHGGVWECPDLFALDHKGKKVWVLLVSINPGGPNKGSATQYFVGDFDGQRFHPYSTDIKWIDHGPDNYAGITWSNTGNRKIFLGWMSNWLYAQVVPTETWRNAMTIPRELKILNVGNDLFVASQPIVELASISKKPIKIQDLTGSQKIELSAKGSQLTFPCRINVQIDELKDFHFSISNDIGEEVLIGFDKNKNQFFIDRSRSGKTGFKNEFSAKSTAPRLSQSEQMNLSLLIDVSSVELFADDGLTAMTTIFFPNKPYDRLHLKAAEKTTVKKIEYIGFKTNRK